MTTYYHQHTFYYNGRLDIASGNFTLNAKGAVIITVSCQRRICLGLCTFMWEPPAGFLFVIPAEMCGTVVVQRVYNTQQFWLFG